MSGFWRGADWFHGLITREQAQDRVKWGGDGAFLLRESQKVCADAMRCPKLQMGYVRI
jgi:hypothetical protein